MTGTQTQVTVRPANVQKGRTHDYLYDKGQFIKFFACIVKNELDIVYWLKQFWLSQTEGPEILSAC